MTVQKHLLLTFFGTYDDASIEAETWQTGIRLSLIFGGTDIVGTLPDNWEPVGHTINRTETDWTITGNWVANSGANTFHGDDYLNDQVAPAWAAYLGGADYSSHAVTTGIRLAPIGSPLGHYVPAVPYLQGTPVELLYTASAPVGGSGGNMLPLQNSVVSSLRTQQPGPRGRGRMFMPSLTVAALDAHGFLSSTQQGNIRDNLVAFLEALSYGSLSPYEVRPIVTGKPYENYGLVTQARVDNIVDTQRRRRRALQGTTVTGTPPY